MKVFSYQLKIQYRGTHYFGWQMQRGSKEKTVQGEINKALGQLCQNQKVKTVAAGRTDAGVHALGQVIKADLPFELPERALLHGLNALLPSDISILEAAQCKEDFSPIRNAHWKEYIYVFTTSKQKSPFFEDLIASYPFSLDTKLMEEACKLLVGTHDFSNFYCVGTETKSKIRTIYECNLKYFKEGSGPLGGIFPECIVLSIIGNGFLKQMVRLVMGTIWNIGRRKVDLVDLENALALKVMGKLGSTAPACGLYMSQVSYSPWCEEVIGPKSSATVIGL